MLGFYHFFQQQTITTYLGRKKRPLEKSLEMFQIDINRRGDIILPFPDAVVIPAMAVFNPPKRFQDRRSDRRNLPTRLIAATASR